MVEGYNPAGLDASAKVEKTSNDSVDPVTTARLQDDARIDQASKLLEWGSNNIRRFDIHDDKKINLGEITLGKNTSTNAQDVEMLTFLSDNFGAFKRNAKDGISVKDLQKNLENAQRIAQENEMARQRAAMLAAQQANNRDLMKPMLATADGDPNGSLFRVLDTVKSHKVDNEVSKRDLEKFLDEYDRRARTGDIGVGAFTQTNRDYVQNLRNGWDSPAVKQLRGTWTDSNNNERANSTISAESLREAAGMASNADAFAAFISPDMQPIRQAPIVTAEMGRKAIPMTNTRVVLETPRVEDQMAREAETKRVKNAQELHDWGKNNLVRYDLGGDSKVNYGEVDLGIRTEKDESSVGKLGEIQTNFDTLAARKKVGVRELAKHYSNEQTTFTNNELARQQRFELEQKQASSRDMITPLFASDNGHPNASLFKVLDGIKGDIDDKVSKKDLKRFVQEYDWRSRHGDVGYGHYTPENRSYVQHLVDNWDSPELVRLRGTYKVQDNNFGRGNNRTREVANSTISGKSLLYATGIASTSDLYALYTGNKQQ